MNLELSYQPLISILVPVYNVAPEILHACIDSVLAQTYPNWQLCLVDDHSTMPEMAQILHAYDDDPRFAIKYRTENGHIARATNDAMEMAEGEFIAFLDCDDVLCADALEVMVRRLNENPNLDFLYSDEDKLTEDGTTLCFPFYKPDWSPDYFLNIMYTCHFSVYRREIALRIGGIPYGCDGAQDYAFTLRFTEETTPDRIAHVPQILYHWRLRVGSIAEDPEAKPYAQAGVIKAKTDALARRGAAGEVEWIPDNFQYRVNYLCDPWPKVSVIILSKDHPALLERCLTSIRTKTDYPDYELIVVDNGSLPSNKAVYETLCAAQDVLYIHEPMPFNFSKSCNLGVTHATGQLFLFLNDDTEVITPVWMRRMAGQAMQPHAGAIGAKLLYPDPARDPAQNGLTAEHSVQWDVLFPSGERRIQHVGVVSLESGPGHAYGGRDDRQVFDYGINRSDYNPLIVTGACLMVDREKLAAVGGWDEAYPETYNDVDLCMRLFEAGYFNCLRNDAILLHYESFTRGSDALQPAKKASMQAAWKRLYAAHPQFRGADPFYNPAYNPVTADYQILPPAQTVQPECVDGQRWADREITLAQGEQNNAESNAESIWTIENPNLHYHLDQGLGGIGLVGPREVLTLRGWAYLNDSFYLLPDAPAAQRARAVGAGFAGNCPPVGQQEIAVLLLHHGKPVYRIAATLEPRPDVKSALHLPAAKVGFSASFTAQSLAPGGYGLALAIRCGDVWHYTPVPQSFEYVAETAVPAEAGVSADKASLAEAASSDAIAVCCHKPSYVPQNRCLLPIHVGAALAARPLTGMQPDDTGDQISAKNPHYCELTAHYWLWKNKKASYYGLFHYRRYLSFADARWTADAEGSLQEDCMDADTLARYAVDETAMASVLAAADLVLPEPYDVRNGDADSVRDLYVKNHAVVDLECMEQAIRDRWPAFVPAMEQYLSGTQNYACSMFLMRADLFDEYSTFLFDVLSQVEAARQPALSDYSAYNARIYGFLGERMLGIYATALKQRGGIRITHLQRVQFANTDRPTMAPAPLGGLPVAFACDDAYAPYTAAAIGSLIAAKAPETTLDIRVLHAGLSAAAQRRITSLATADAPVRCVDISWYLRREAQNGGYMPQTAAQIALYLGELLPEDDRVLYLDSDILVKDDLAPLFAAHAVDAAKPVDTAKPVGIANPCGIVHMGAAAVAGVPNVDVITVHNRYNPPLLAQWQQRAAGRSLRTWVSPGVLLFDLVKWRSQVQPADIAAAMAGFPAGHETEAVNLLGDVPPAQLEFRWNLQQPDNFAALVGPRDGAIAALSVAETAAWRAALAHPAILHYTGNSKPWAAPDTQWAEEWWMAARRLPHYEQLLAALVHGTAASATKHAALPGAVQTPPPSLTALTSAASGSTVSGSANAASIATAPAASAKQAIKQTLKKVLPQPVIETLKKMR